MNDRSVPWRHSVFLVWSLCLLAGHAATGQQPTPQTPDTIGRTTLAAEPQKSVLVLMETRRESPMGEIFVPALRRAIEADFAGRIDFYTEYLDSPRFPAPGQLDATRTFFRSKYRNHTLDVIVAVDKTARDLLASGPDALFPGVPIVFYSLDPLVAPVPNAAWIITPLKMKESLESALALFPRTDRVVVVSGAAPFDTYYDGLARNAFKAFEGRIAFTYLHALPIPELLRRVAVLPPHSLVFYTSIAQDGDGRKFLPFEMTERVSAASSAPTFGWVSLQMGGGIVGGRIPSAELLAKHLAALAVRVLAGERPDAIPVASVEWSEDIFDWRQLKRWRISDRQLPAGSTVLYREPNAWEKYEPYVIGGGVLLVLQTGLIGALLAQRRQRSRAEAALVESQNRYSLATAAGSVGVWDWDLQTNDVYVDPVLQSILGLATRSRLGVEAMLSRIHPEDVAAATNQAEALVRGVTDVYELEHQVQRPDGSVRWLFTRGSLIRSGDRTPLRVLGTSTDITHRKRAQQERDHLLEQLRQLAGALIETQEAERARIARDLHDDTSQQLAGLSIALSRLKQRVAAAGGPEDLQEDVASLQQRTGLVAQNVRSLSHGLHPALLQHVGLAAALVSYCAELRSQQSMELDFDTEGQCDSVEHTVALSLYRVTQEALRNVVTHAAASRASVRLVCDSDGVQLTITDDGKGFDAGAAGRTGKGLGLISMQERVRLIGGTLTIVAELAKGTRVHVRVPADRQAVTHAGDRAGHDSHQS